MATEWEKYTTVRFNHSELISIVGCENGFSEQRARAWMADHWYFVVQASTAYFFLIFGVKLFMKNREPFDLQRPLNIWNAILALFSTLGFLFMAPDFFGTLWTGGFRATYCNLNGIMEGTPGIWTFVFFLSKLAEFTDTFFIVLRKKPLMFLHWYHHILTLLYGFYTYPVNPAYNRWLVILNLFVHSFMYTYYFLRSIHVPIPGAIAKSITSIQIIQFILSIIVLIFCGVEYYLLRSMGDCTIDMNSFWFATIMDLTYLVLFVNFFLKSYVVKGGKDNSAASTMIENGLSIRFEKKEKLGLLFTHIYQVDDGTIYYYRTSYKPPDRLFVKWEEKGLLPKRLLPSMHHRDHRDVHPGGLLGIQRGKLIFQCCKSSEQEREEKLKGNAPAPSIRMLSENAVMFENCSFPVYFNDAYPFLYTFSFPYLHVFNTETMAFLPALPIQDCFQSCTISGVHNGIITVKGNSGEEAHLMTAQLPEGYFEPTEKIEENLQQQ
ncbi:hypothetical protein PRIPAC_89738 [Pristionchus pacificus]|uniref:Elongation of very long chain fatty acids protein n=1 Tax=Pristionchus pacificus TaxID=54126 RepID=A0A2A6CX39_PRIPA|nr:hypothetical protein PRIPAC_89738 [Pristionchus pacificus]|eukprot:PDM82617.1 hypothetical protein PRIPAC_37010 [Pristionchus pacificus]